MTGQPAGDPATPEAYIAALDEPKRGEVRHLHELIRRELPEFEPRLQSGMIGYGAYHYRYRTGREGESFRVALASNKTGISVYVAAMDENGYLAEQAAPRLGKATVGRSCIRFKKLADIDQGALVELLRKVPSAIIPGA